MNERRAKQIRKIAKMLVYTSPDLEFNKENVKKANQLLKNKYKNGTLMEFLVQVTQNKDKEEQEVEQEPDVADPRPL